MRPQAFVALFLALGISGFAQEAAGQARQYRFVNVVDNTQSPQFRQFYDPYINNDRTVAFSGDNGFQRLGIFTAGAAGGPLTTIAAGGAGPGQFRTVSDPGISNAGLVAFRGDDASGEGVYAGSGGPLTRIAHTSQGFVGMEGRSINDAGVAALLGVRPGFRNSGIFAGNGGPLTTIADTSGPFSDFSSVPAINDAGTVAFRADLDDGGQGVFTGNGGPTTTIMMNTRGIGFNHPRINSAGTVAVRQQITTTQFAILTGNGGPVTAVADTAGPYRFLSDPAINAAGVVVFRAGLDGGGDEGVFTGPDPIADKVIASGDSLFGSAFEGLNSDLAVSINDSGVIAFNYALANGVQGIALAVPVVPEPVGLIPLFLGSLWLTRPRGVRRW
jgi:hypothetical protein